MSEALTLKPYHRNPRQITKKRAERLKDTLARFGDLSGIFHNIRTGEMGGGHMREMAFGDDYQIEITERYDKPDSQGTVAHGYIIWKGNKYSYRQVDWDEDTMAEANIAANVGAGDWDWDILTTKWEPVQLTDWGFDAATFNSLRTDLNAVGALLGSEGYFMPETEPEIGAHEYTEEDVTKVGQVLSNKFIDNPEQVEVFCPHCANNFYINKHDL